MPGARLLQAARPNAGRAALFVGHTDLYELPTPGGGEDKVELEQEEPLEKVL
jgi:hypothetical protein